MRLLTLVCFFHFSGLNNGFTYLLDASSAGDGSRSPGFVVLARFAAGINPLNWEKAASLANLRGLFSRSGNVLECASRNAVQNLFVDSLLSHILVSQSMRCKLGNASTAAGSEAGLLAPGAPRIQPQTQAAGNISALNAFDFLSQEGREAWLSAKRLQYLPKNIHPGGLAEKTGVYARYDCRDGTNIFCCRTDTGKGIREGPAKRPKLFRQMNLGKSDDDPAAAKIRAGKFFNTGSISQRTGFFYARVMGSGLSLSVFLVKLITKDPNIYAKLKSGSVS